jgi:hypothetical protein
MANFVDNLYHAIKGWNAFSRPESDKIEFIDRGMNSSSRPDRARMFVSNERSIVAAIYTRLSIDVASLVWRHVRLDDDGRFAEEMKTGLNNCLTIEANIDQTGRAFKQDVAMTLFDRGVIAIVPVDSDEDPTISGSFDVQTLRVGTIVNWFPEHVTISLYNEKRGERQDITLPKKMVAIVQNPFYSVMNEPNSTLQRVMHKLNLLDAVDAATSSGKLDIIIQLPYVVKTETKRLQSEQRRADLESQVNNSRLGVAYTDGTEKITQLNRAVENNMLPKIQYLTEMLYAEMGITKAVLDGTASEEEMLNYHNRTIEPVASAIIDSMKRTFLTKTGRTQGQSIEFYRDPFKLVAVGNIAEIADKLTRNEVLTGNEVRQILGFRPAKDATADELRNKNLPLAEPVVAPLAAIPQPEYLALPK